MDWIRLRVTPTVSFVLVVSCLLSLGCRREEAPLSAAGTRKIEIGVVLPFSGEMAVYGENARRGLLLAEDELEKGHPGLNLELKFQDSGSTPTGTVTAVHRLIDVEDVQFIIGGLTSSGALAAAPYAQEKGVLFFSPAASAPGIPEIGDLVLRDWQSDSLLAELYGKAAYDLLGLRAVAIVRTSNDYGETNSKYFRQSFEAKGGKVLLTRTIGEGSESVKTILTQVQSLRGVDGFLMAVYPDEYKALYQEMGREGRGGVQRLATDTFYSPELLATLGGTAERTICAVAAKPGNDYPPREQFIEAYLKRFGGSGGPASKPGLATDTAYDGLKLVVGGILASDGRPQQVASWIIGRRDYPGASGKLTFTSTGDIEGSISLYRVEGGSFVPISH